jgi:copper/silver efflux system protein
MSAIGGEPVTTTVEGRERYSVNVRYLRDYRTDLDALQRVLVSTPTGAQVPLVQLADISLKTGPGMIRDENGRLSGYVYVDVSGRDIGSYVTDAKNAVRQKVSVPAGYQLVWSGQYESIQRVKERLKIVLPVTLFIVFLLLYFNTGSAVKTGIILLAVPFSAIGAIWFLYLLNYNMSIAVWVGLIALLGVDAETAVFMLLYLDLAYHDAISKGLMNSWDDLREAIVHGAVKRLRPKVMTVACMLFGPLPIMWSVGAGGDVMKRIAAPMIGGILTSFLMELVIYPPIFAIWKWNFEVKPRLNKNRRSEPTVQPQQELVHV